MKNIKISKNNIFKIEKVNGKDVRLPKDWDYVYFKDMIEMLPNSKKHQIPASQIKKSGSIPVLTQENNFISGYSNDLLKIKKIDKEYILFGDHTTNFKYISFDFILGGDGTQVFSTKINTKFFYFLCINNIIQPTGYNRHFKNLKEKIIFIPKSDKEINSIAEILTKQESIINNLEKVIDNKEKILKEFSHRLLSGEIRLKDENGTVSMYKNPDHNWKVEKVNGKDVEIPKDWGKDKLINRDITNIKTGIKKYSGIMPYYATGDVGINKLFKPDGYYDYDSLPSRANLSLKNNSIYFARMQNTKKIINNINNFFKDFILSTGFLGLSINNDVFSQTFIYHIILNDNFNQLKDSLCFGGTQKSLNDNNAKKIEFIFPKISEQKLIADYLSKQEESIKNLQKLLENEKKKFDYLLDNLLSGKYLVENTEEEEK